MFALKQLFNRFLMFQCSCLTVLRSHTVNIPVKWAQSIILINSVLANSTFFSGSLCDFIINTSKLVTDCYILYENGIKTLSNTQLCMTRPRNITLMCRQVKCMSLSWHTLTYALSLLSSRYICGHTAGRNVVPRWTTVLHEYRYTTQVKQYKPTVSFDYTDAVYIYIQMVTYK